jgi:hypothetical protein
MGSQRTHREAALARFTERQFGAFTREQAVEVGFTPAAIKKRITRDGTSHSTSRSVT